MRAIWAGLWGVLALAALLARGALADMFQAEIRARLGRLPAVLLRLAIRRIPREWRDDFGCEWLAELRAIRQATSEIPVTGLAREFLFALGLLVRGPAIVREFTGDPARLATARALLRRLGRRYLSGSWHRTGHWMAASGGALALNVAATAVLAPAAGLALYQALSIPPGLTAASTAGITAQPPAVQAAPPASASAFMARYFSAINTRDYQAYRRLLSSQLQEGLTEQRFLSGYGSTADSDGKIGGVTRNDSGLMVVTVTFTSRQSPAQSPDASACDSWRVSLYLQREGSEYVVERPPAGYRAIFSPCD